MNKKFMICILAVLLVVSAICHPYFKKLEEGYSNYTLEDATGELKYRDMDLLVQDSFPVTGSDGISDNTSQDIWSWYPTFQVGSYSQETNNIRYPERPTNGRCTPASMCGALYKKINTNNVITPLPPVEECGTRVGYFSTDVANRVLPFEPQTINNL